MQVLSEGQRLNHPQYGLGVVRESDAERTTIDFDEHGEKKFVTSMMTAELIGEPPAKPVRVRSQRRKTAKAAAAPAKRKPPAGAVAASD
jgi:hypothetical protein